jgi:hypothetical protein
MLKIFILNSVIILSSLGGSEQKNILARDVVAEYVNAHLVSGRGQFLLPLGCYHNSVSIDFFLRELNYVSELTNSAFFVEYSKEGQLTMIQEYDGYKPVKADFTTNTRIFTDGLFLMWKMALKSSLYREDVKKAPTFLDKIRVAYGEEAFKEAFRGFSGEDYEDWVPNSGCVDVLASDDRPGLFSKMCSRILPKGEYSKIRD